MSRFAKSLILDQKGQGLTEYITFLLLISICSIAAAQTLGKTVKSKIEEANRHINSGISLDDDGGGNAPHDRKPEGFHLPGLGH